MKVWPYLHSLGVEVWSYLHSLGVEVWSYLHSLGVKVWKCWMKKNVIPNRRARTSQPEGNPEGWAGKPRLARALLLGITFYFIKHFHTCTPQVCRYGNSCTPRVCRYGNSCTPQIAMVKITLKVPKIRYFFKKVRKFLHDQCLFFIRENGV